MKKTPFSVALVLVGASVFPSCHKASEPLLTEVVALRRDTLPVGPEDNAWVDVPTYNAKLLVQDVVEPRLIEPSTHEVRVQAVSNGDRMAVRLIWEDTTNNDLPGAARFSDACALQVPRAVTPDVPDPQMGDSAHPVEITYWRASWQAMVDGRGETIQDLYPNAVVDHYPYEAAPLKPSSREQRQMQRRYAPAHALENKMEGARDQPVQDLIAAGPGSLDTMESSLSEGSGLYTGTEWKVVLSRLLPRGLEAGERSVIAFAVWQGANEEVGSRKMRSAWVPFVMQKEL